MKKVLMLDTAPMLWDGITMVIYNYISNMDRSDIIVDVAAINNVDPKLRTMFEELGCKFHELTMRNTSQLKYVRELATLVRNEKYEIVHIHCNSCTAAVDLLGAWLGGAKARIPHSHNTHCGHARTHKMLRPLFDMLYTHKFACGYEAGQWLFPGKEVKVWKNAINTERFRFNPNARKTLREEYNLKDKIAVGHVAHFTPHKNHKFLLEVWKDVVERDNRYVLFLIGDGKLRTDIEQQIRNLDIEKNVVMTGVKSNVPDYLSAMDMMVLPSEYEGLPLVAIEWQISGLTSLLSGTITKECGLTDSVKYIPLEKSKWAEAILNKNVQEDKDRVNKSIDNIETVSKAGFNIKNSAEELKQFYKSI